MIVSVLSLVKQRWAILSLLVLSLITVLSLAPVPNVPSVPGSDKTHHLVAYFLLMFPIALRRPNNWLLIGVFFFCWSGAIELVQPYVNRYGEWLDLAANTSGMLLACLIAYLLRPIVKDV